jgi:hypothetical protein
MRAPLVLAAALVLAACGGPGPVVDGTEIRPASDGGTLVVVALRNTTGGEGQVSLEVTLRDRTTGQAVGRAERAVSLRPRERLQVTVALRPATAGDLVAEVRARYPPD